MSQDRAVTTLLRTGTFASELNDAVGIDNHSKPQEQSQKIAAESRMLAKEALQIAWNISSLVIPVMHNSLIFRANKKPVEVQLDALKQMRDVQNPRVLKNREIWYVVSQYS